MGVIQSSLNQSLLATAALVSQSPAFQEAQKEKSAKREYEEFNKELPSVLQALSERSDPNNRSVKELGKDIGRLDYVNKVSQKAQDIAIKRRDQGMYSSAYGLSYIAQEHMNETRALREMLIKQAKQKAKDQTDQMNEIKQHVKYSEEDDFDNPYVGW